LKIKEVRYLGDHKRRNVDPPRQLDPWEARAIERIVSWPKTAPTLLRAVEGISVRAECEECASVFLVGGDVPLVDSEGRSLYGVFPGELWFGEGGSETHVLLHIADGHVDELQVYRGDGQPAAERPDVEAMHLSSSLASSDEPDREERR
jgi:hypothetical protein